jgi:hypothetical protein
VSLKAQVKEHSMAVRKEIRLGSVTVDLLAQVYSVELALRREQKTVLNLAHRSQSLEKAHDLAEM